MECNAIGAFWDSRTSVIWKPRLLKPGIGIKNIWQSDQSIQPRKRNSTFPDKRRLSNVHRASDEAMPLLRQRLIMAESASQTAFHIAVIRRYWTESINLLFTPTNRRTASADFQREAKRPLKRRSHHPSRPRHHSAPSAPYFFSTTIFPPSDLASTLRSYMPSA